MGMWNCDIEDCNNVSVHTYGECVLCGRHLCVKHLGPEYHKCPKWEVRMNQRSYIDYADHFSRMRKNTIPHLHTQNRRK